PGPDRLHPRQRLYRQSLRRPAPRRPRRRRPVGRRAAAPRPARPREQCRVVKPCCPEVNNVVAISGLRSGAVGGGAGRSGRTRQGVPAVAGLAEEAKAGPLPELGKQVPGFYAEPAREFAAGPVLAGLAGHDAGDLVSSAVRAGLAGTGCLVRAAGARGGTVRRRDPDRDLYPGDRHGLAGTVLVTFLVADVVAGGGAFDLAGAVARAAGGQQ